MHRGLFLLLSNRHGNRSGVAVHADREDQGKPITPRQIAKLLEPFGVIPGSIRMASATAKGYKLDDFGDAFVRYVTDTSVTPSQVNEIKENRLDGAVTPVGVVTDLMERKVNENGRCDGVTAKNEDDGPKSDDTPDLPHFLRRPPQQRVVL